MIDEHSAFGQRNARTDMSEVRRNVALFVIVGTPASDGSVFQKGYREPTTGGDGGGDADIRWNVTLAIPIPTPAADASVM